MITTGVLALLTSGAIDMALGEKMRPPISSTFSRVISSCAAALAIGPPRTFRVADDELDRIAAEILLVQLDIETRAFLELVAEIGGSARFGRDEPDLDLAGVRRSGGEERRGAAGQKYRFDVHA